MERFMQVHFKYPQVYIDLEMEAIF